MPPAQVALILGDIRGRIDAVARLHRLLSELDDGAPVPLDHYLRDVVEATVASLATAAAFRLSLALAPVTVAADQAVAIGIIVTEMVTNAIKYSHPTGIPGEIAVTCGKTGDGATAVEIADDGIGLPQAFDPHCDGGLGFRLVRAFAAQLKAKLAFNSRAVGLRFQLTLPA